MSIVAWLSYILVIFCVITSLLGSGEVALIAGTLGVMGLILNAFRIDFIKDLRDLKEINQIK